MPTLQLDEDTPKITLVREMLLAIDPKTEQVMDNDLVVGMCVSVFSLLGMIVCVCVCESAFRGTSSLLCGWVCYEPVSPLRCCECTRTLSEQKFASRYARVPCHLCWPGGAYSR
jgi:hypothetical protein